MATNFGRPLEEGLNIDLRMTHHDIANAIGSTRVSIIRILSKLRETGWLKKLMDFWLLLPLKNIFIFQIFIDQFKEQYIESYSSF